MDGQLSRDGRLGGKTALVTGAGSGREDEIASLGSAIAIVLAREGADVCLLDRERARAEVTLERLRQEGLDANVVEADVTAERSCAAAVAAASERSGRLDVLVNNVGIANAGPGFEPGSAEAFERVMAVNVRSALQMSGHAVERMTDGGSIVNVSSIAGLRVSGGGTGYGPSKAALEMLTRELAVDQGRRGIRANTVAPGHIFTPLVAAELDQEQRELRRRLAPLGTEGTAWDVAAVVAFLASDEARFVTATCIPVDGGITALGVLRGYGLAGEPA